jgi:hypothetical protein
MHPPKAVVSTSLDQETMRALDEYANEQRVTRGSALRDLITGGLRFAFLHQSALVHERVKFFQAGACLTLEVDADG